MVEITESDQLLAMDFETKDVLKGVEEVKLRSFELKKGEFLGNNYGTKTQITFRTTDGVRQVNSQIWLVTDRGVKLKEGPTIPIQSIIEVQSWE